MIAAIKKHVILIIDYALLIILAFYCSPLMFKQVSAYLLGKKQYKSKLSKNQITWRDPTAYRNKINWKETLQYHFVKNPWGNTFFEYYFLKRVGYQNVYTELLKSSNLNKFQIKKRFVVAYIWNFKNHLKYIYEGN